MEDEVKGFNTALEITESKESSKESTAIGRKVCV
jgi:hypothetical protein